MMRKSVYALAVTLALGTLTLGSDAFAMHGGGGHMGGGGHFGGGFHGRSVPHGGGHFGGGHMGGHFGHGGHFGGHPAHFVRGHDHHFWHGRWWGYGVGPCWV
jgi:hypothetical protein